MVAAIANRYDVTTITCFSCAKNYAIVYNRDDMVDWMIGQGYIQDCLPYLSSGERELILSNTCGECFDKMFSTP